MQDRKEAFRVINGIPFYHSSMEASRDGKVIYGKGFDEDALIIAQTPFAVIWPETFSEFNTEDLEEAVNRTYYSAIANIPHLDCLTEILKRYPDRYIVTPPLQLIRKTTTCIAVQEKAVMLLNSPDEAEKGDYELFKLIMPIPFTIVPYEERQD